MDVHTQRTQHTDGQGRNPLVGSPGRQTRVLLAEPGGTVRERMATILRQQGFDVMLAEDGLDVLCRLPELRPDLLLMATTLPRLTGQQVCALIRQSPDFCDLAVILLSEDGNLLDRAQADISGADGCLCKPFRLADLESVLDRLRAQDSRVCAGAS
jgi:twitching motility two-component system response regulator PilG